MEKLSPEKAAELLRKNGLEVSIEQAGHIMDFLRMLADIIGTHYLEHGPRKNKSA